MSTTQPKNLEDYATISNRIAVLNQEEVRMKKMHEEMELDLTRAQIKNETIAEENKKLVLAQETETNRLAQLKSRVEEINETLSETSVALAQTRSDLDVAKQELQSAREQNVTIRAVTDKLMEENRIHREKMNTENAVLESRKQKLIDTLKSI